MLRKVLGVRRASFRLTLLASLALATVAGCITVLAHLIVLGQPGAYATEIVLPLMVLGSLPAITLIARRHPDEPWLFRFLVGGLAVKILASYFRYLTLVNSYQGAGDATGYHVFGKSYATAIYTGDPAPHLTNHTSTNFIRWITGWIYVTMGPRMLAGFFVFGFAAFWGSYLWYRAAAVAVPGLHKRLYLAFMLFLPSIVFWPSSIGKESLMHLGLGVVALGAALLLSQHTGKALPAIFAGGWLVQTIRPHVAAIFALGLATAYLLGRVVRIRPIPVSAGFARVVGIAVVVILASATITQAGRFLGLQGGVSKSSVETRLKKQTERTSEGGSQFNSEPALTPTRLPQGLATVFFRPWPYEASKGLQLVASVETLILLLFMLSRFRLLGYSLRRIRAVPYLMFSVVVVLLYAATFSSLGNFGLLVRQRTLALPALLVLVCVGEASRRTATRRTRTLPATLDLLGVPVWVEVRSPELSERAQALLVDLPRVGRTPVHRVVVERERSSRAAGYTVRDGKDVLQSGLDDADAIGFLLWYLTRLASSSPRMAVVHAGAVARNHQGVMVVGASGAGKTTLTTALVGRGFQYLSDELAPVALDDGRIHPYARPLVIRHRPVEAAPRRRPAPTATLVEPVDVGPPTEGEQYVTPSSLRPDALSGPVRPRLVVFVQYEPGAPTRLSRLSPATALDLLGLHCQNLAHLGPPGFITLARVVSTCPSYELVYGDSGAASTTVEALSHGARTEPATTMAVLDPRLGVPKPGRPRPAPNVTALALGEEVVVHTSGRREMHHLNPSASLVWRCCDGRRDVDAVVAAVAGIVDQPAEDISADVRAVVAHLCDLGLLIDPRTTRTARVSRSRRPRQR